MDLEALAFCRSLTLASSHDVANFMPNPHGLEAGQLARQHNCNRKV